MRWPARAECMFVDPVADIAVQGRPDSQALNEEAYAYDDLIEHATAIRIDNPPESAKGWLLGLDGRWGECIVQHPGGRWLWIKEAKLGIVGGMSGSPIVNDKGSAVGVLGMSSGSADTTLHTEGGPEPRLTHCLPGWVLLESRQARHV